jgi:transposase
MAYHIHHGKAMAYRKITAMDIWEILRRHRAGQSISQISTALGYDRKSIRKYLSLAKNNPIVLQDKEAAVEYFNEHLQQLTGRPQTAQNLLMAYREELIGLITDKEHPLKPKHALEVLTERHPKLRAVSYTSFKRYARNIRYELYPEKTTCRIEVTPGHQLQIDYGKVGLLFDPVTKKKRVLYAFIGTLSHSHHKYVEFTFKQSQQSFVQSHIDMFQFFGGIPRTIVIDNLKAALSDRICMTPRSTEPTGRWPSTTAASSTLHG